MDPHLFKEFEQSLKTAIISFPQSRKSYINGTGEPVPYQGAWYDDILRGQTDRDTPTPKTLSRIERRSVDGTRRQQSQESLSLPMSEDGEKGVLVP